MTVTATKIIILYYTNDIVLYVKISEHVLSHLIFTAVKIKYHFGNIHFIGLKKS